MIRLLKILALIVAVFLCASSAFAIQADIQPPNLFPGDAFMVRLSGITPAQNSSVSFEGAEVPLSGCGEGCAIGIGVVGIETEPGEKRILINSGSDRLTLPLLVRTPKFPEIRLKVPKSKVILSPEDLARFKSEEEKLNGIWKQTSPPLFQGDFMLPLPNGVALVFGAKRIFNDTTLSVHRGIDLKGAKGERVRAANAGRIVLAEETIFGGNTLIIDHGSGIYTIYMHLERFAANPGDLVAKGDIIGFVGSTGRATGPHLHFGVRILSINANPLSLIKLQINEKH